MATTQAAAETKAGILDQLDQLYEFERQPVTEDNLQPGAYFAGVFSGEHIAGTEFVIGALFVSFGARPFDVLVGLLVGNLLAVLSWTLVCAPLAVQTRLTLYWYLRRIAGPGVTAVYNVLNAILYCVLAGAMITVSASAIRIPFGIAAQRGWVPQDFSFVLVVLGVGAVVVTLAILGFKRLAQFSSICSPWMVLMFPAGALLLLPSLGSVRTWDAFWTVAETKIWPGPGPEVAHPLGFWHIVAFAWVCNLAMHLGLSDMALFRFARRSSYGLYSAFGMYLGHYLAWICVGIMGAATATVLKKPLAELDPGDVAYTALGVVGALCVVLAGWTTANPTLYRAGLAFQAVTPGWPRWLVTLVAGVITTLIACSPIFFVRLLDFVAIYGIVLVPVGAIVVAEHWIFPRIGLTQYWSARKRQWLNWPALTSWGLALVFTAAAWCSKQVLDREIVHEFFLVIPVWIVTTAAYVGLAALAGARESLPELPVEDASVAPPQAPAAPTVVGTRLSLIEKILLYASGLAALVSLFLWLGTSMQEIYDISTPDEDGFLVWKVTAWLPHRFGPAQITFLVSALVWAHLWEKSKPLNPTLYRISGLVALLALVLCLVFPISGFLGLLMVPQVQNHLILLTIMYFLGSLIWVRQREKRPAPGATG